MKFIYMMVLLSSMLFGLQKQIILGSYSVAENAQNALEIVKKQIANDENLSKVLDVNTTRLTTNIISGYSVVSVNAYDTYADLLPVMKIFRTYYEDAFVLRYPIEDFSKKEDIKAVETKAIEEVKASEAIKEIKAIEEMIYEEDMSEDEIIAQETLVVKELINEEKMAKKAAKEETPVKNNDIEKIEELVEEIKEIEKTTAMQAPQSMSEIMADVERLHSKNSSNEDYYLIGGVVLLFLLIASFLIYKKATKKEELY